VVVLDQDRIVETKAVVETAATTHRVFLQRPQSRRGLSRAADPHLGAFRTRDVVGGERGDA
jgi:hypothetical protein